MNMNDWITNNETIIFFTKLSNEYKETFYNILTSLKDELNKVKEQSKRDIEIFNDIISILNSNDIKEENGFLIYRNVKIYDYTNILDPNSKYQDELDRLNIEIDDLTNEVNVDKRRFGLKRKNTKERTNRLTNELSILEQKRDKLNSIIISKNCLNDLTDKQKDLIKYYFEYKEKMRNISNLEVRINNLSKNNIDRDILNIAINNLLKQGIIKQEDLDYIDSFIACAFNYELVDNKNDNSNIINAYIKQLKNNPKRKKELNV